MKLIALRKPTAQIPKMFYSRALLPVAFVFLAFLLTPSSYAATVKGKVVDVQGTIIELDIGSEKGIKAGDTGRVYYMVSIVGVKEPAPVHVAHFKITHPTAQSSMAKIEGETTGEIRIGYLVEITVQEAKKKPPPKAVEKETEPSPQTVKKEPKPVEVSRVSYDTQKLFEDVVNIIKKNYIKEVNTENLITGDIEELLNSLDPYSAYYDPEMYRELQKKSKRRFSGVGIDIYIKDEILTVIAPIEDTPAFRAGIQAGDKILKINEEPTKGLSLMECVKRLRGAKGTKVTITIIREGFTQMQDITIVRDIINIQSVKSKTLEKGYGLLKILQFQETTAADARKALEALQRENPEGLSGLILDLRNNPGGLLDQAVEVSDLFLDSGVIVTVKGRKEEVKMVFNAHKKGTMPLWPMVVLVNRGSAGASEIVAGALQDCGRAVIMGSSTFGNGSIQTIFPLDDSSAIRLTTAVFYTPKGRTIHERGIQPDIPLQVVAKVPSTEKVKEEVGVDTEFDAALKHLEGM